jgi:2-polyprenyl-3-methyl-5-hydroxy-6-metoxy-1,4-benzoquinol methylase
MPALPLRRNTDAPARQLVSIDSESAVYRDGSYLKHNPSWHTEESPFKVRQILRMMRRQKLAPKSVCDIGCGAGLVLTELQPHLPSECICWGYDVSPDALDMCTRGGNGNLRFRLCDVRKDTCDTFFDLLLMLDVFEHVEDYIGLVRTVRSKAKLKLFHIPLDLSV